MTGRAAGLLLAAVFSVGCCFPVPPGAAAVEPAPKPLESPLGQVSSAPAARTAPTFLLGRSVNIETWVRWNHDISSWDDYMSDSAIAQLAVLGFGTVRLAVFPQYMMRHSGHVRMGHWAYVAHAVDRFNQAGLGVVVDLHTEALVRTRFIKHARYRARYIGFVGRVAALIAHWDPQMVALSPMQEPNDPQGRWSAWQRMLHDSARAGAPATTLVATGDDYGSVRGLLETGYIDDPNLIWDVHLYDPFTFTHQGAPFMGYPYRAFRRVPFPSTPHNVGPSIRKSQAAAPERWDARVRAELRQYGGERWRRRTIDHRVRQMVDWSDQHGGATDWIGEFGADSQAPPPAAYRWWRVTRSAAEGAGIHWSAWFWWDYANLHGGGQYDPELAQALGLGPAAPG